MTTPRTPPDNTSAAEALRAAATDARGMHDPAAPDCAEWADWLDARAERLAAHPAPPPATGEGDGLAEVVLGGVEDHCSHSPMTGGRVGSDGECLDCRDLAAHVADAIRAAGWVKP